MQHVQIPAVQPRSIEVPSRVAGLVRLAYNLYWTWNPRPKQLFQRIDPAAWALYRNPIAVLQEAENYQGLLDDPDFTTNYHAALEDFDRYMASDDTWFKRHFGRDNKDVIAYFCAEYGLHESMPVYSGGLGVLAGDHCKTASDMGIPLVAVGLLYHRGYFRQTVDADGHQQHEYPVIDPHRLPLQRITSPESGRALKVAVELPGRQVWCAAWLAQVGRVPLILLDTNIGENDPADRPITGMLYVRGREMRLHQELVLGVGGVRVLQALGIAPTVWHLNEGHSAFLLLERMRELAKRGRTLSEAVSSVGADSVFTIHTPVPAGNERFDRKLADGLTRSLASDTEFALGDLLDYGRGQGDDRSVLDLTALCLRTCHATSAVSQLHGQTANETWRGTAQGEILGITNGVHLPSWVGLPMQRLYRSHGIDINGLEAPDNQNAEALYSKLKGIPDEVIWESHQGQKKAMIVFLRRRLHDQMARHGEGPSALGTLHRVLDPNALTIGFARRFATYKRAFLLFRDEARLLALLNHETRPVQVVFAGKAHPADRPGQEYIQRIFEKSRSDGFRGRIFYVEDYDMEVGRFLVQGVDVWLNNPRRPLEASGTSGMKAAANGVLNLSILDGWWDEGFTGENGWAIGQRDAVGDEFAQDEHDARALYELLEREVVPRYYERNAGVPAAWIESMRRAAATTVWRFSTYRMLTEYTKRLYRIRGG